MVLPTMKPESAIFEGSRVEVAAPQPLPAPLKKNHHAPCNKDLVHLGTMMILAWYDR